MAVYFDKSPGWGDYIAQALSQLLVGHVQNQQQQAAVKAQQDYERDNMYAKWNREDSQLSNAKAALDSMQFFKDDRLGGGKNIMRYGITPGVTDAKMGHATGIYKHMYPDFDPGVINLEDRAGVYNFNKATGEFSTPTFYGVGVNPTKKVESENQKASVLGSANITAGAANARAARELAQQERQWNIERGDPIPSTGVVGDDGEIRYVNKKGEMVRSGIFPKTPPPVQGPQYTLKDLVSALGTGRALTGESVPGMEGTHSLINQALENILNPRVQQPVGQPVTDILGFSGGGQGGGYFGGNRRAQAEAMADTMPEVNIGLLNRNAVVEGLMQGLKPEQLVAALRAKMAADAKKK